MPLIFRATLPYFTCPGRDWIHLIYIQKGTEKNWFFFSRLNQNFLTNFGHESTFLTNLTNAGKIIGGGPESQFLRKPANQVWRKNGIWEKILIPEYTRFDAQMRFWRSNMIFVSLFFIMLFLFLFLAVSLLLSLYYEFINSHTVTHFISWPH